LTPVFLKINSEEEAVQELKKNDVDPGGISLMAPKMLGVCLKIKSISLKSAHIIKQEMLSLGGDAALPRGAMEFVDNKVDVIIIGTLKQLRLLCQKLKMQPFGLDETGEELSNFIENYYSEPSLIKCPRTVLDFSRGPLIMGILNVTPDSFYDGGKYFSKDDAINRGLKLVEDGADIIDIGGESTRPGSEPVSEEEELKRVLPVISELSRRTDIPISIDTYKGRVARAAIDSGAQIVNDISGLKFDANMAQVVAEKDVPVVIMHIKGTPKDMQSNPHYEDVIQELLDYFEERIRYAINNGIDSNKIIIDPGIGFGKRLVDNLAIIKNIGSFKIFGKPIMIGISRKSFIGKILDLPPDERLEGSITATMHALYSGVKIVRVHDVKEMKRCIRIYNEINMS
jgi:dihydropteroate synthase